MTKPPRPCDHPDPWVREQIQCRDGDYCYGRHAWREDRREPAGKPVQIVNLRGCPFRNVIEDWWMKNWQAEYLKRIGDGACTKKS